MSGYNGAGVFTFTYNWVNDAANGIPITASRMDTEFSDATGGFNLVICRDGQSTITANIPWGGFKITGLGAPNTVGDALSYGRAISATTGSFIGQLQGLGTTTNDDATTGQIGEYISGSVQRGSGAAYTSGVTLNVTTISLTAGDWDISGMSGITVSGGTITQFGSGAGSTSATLPISGQNGLSVLHAGISITGDDGATFAGRISLAGPTTIYLMGSPIFSGTALAYGFIGARRAR